MDRTLESYGENRDALLIKIAETLSKDERFVAAWLTGSLSRDDADALSDVDLRLVVSDEFSASLCTRPEQVSAQTSPERHALFNLFGMPALIHENNNNAPDSGTFTFVLYAESALMVDWTLIPMLNAARPTQTRLLFEKIPIPIATPLEPEDIKQSQELVAEQWAFFWMMTAITIKYATRDDSVFVTAWTEHLHDIADEIERRVNGEPWTYKRGSRSQFQPALEKQLESLRTLCSRMLRLKAQVSDFIGSEPLTPTVEIEYLFSLAQNASAQS